MKRVGLIIIVAAGIGVITGTVVALAAIAFEHGWTPFIAGGTAAVFTMRVVARIERPKTHWTKITWMEGGAVKQGEVRSDDKGMW